MKLTLFAEKGFWLSTRHDGKAWEDMLWFPTVREAMAWLVETYQPDADFWNGVEVRILKEK